MNLRLPGKFYSNIARHVAYRFARDLYLPLQMTARDSSAEFIHGHMPDAIPLDSRKAILATACKAAHMVKGCFCEFGVYKGESLRYIAKLAPKRSVHGFDSFGGLPQQWRAGFDVATFKTDIPVIREKNVELHVGLFNEVLPTFIQEMDESIAFAHIDCDIYSSTQTVLDLISPRLAHGSVLLFDEYFNYPGWEEHEHKALTECLHAGLVEARYAAYNQIGEQVMVIVLDNKHIA